MRQSDPVVLAGKQLPKLLSKSNSAIGAYAFSGGRLAPIPFQIDDRSKQGGYVFGAGDGTLDPQDEVVFMARDAREKLPKEKWLDGPGMEVELVDPNTGRKAWVYFFAPPAGPERAKEKYVRYDAAKDEIRTSIYTIRYMKKFPMIYDYFVIAKAAGGRGRNIFDRFKVRTSIDAGIVFAQKNEEDFNTKVLGAREGPVRIIRSTESHLSFQLGVKTNPVVNNTILYTDIIQSPALTTMDVPGHTLKLIKSGFFIGTTDLNHNAFGYTYFNERNRKGVLVDGKMSDAEKKLDARPTGWGVMADIGKAAWMYRTIKAPGVALVPNLYYVDDLNAKDAPDADPGQVGSAGFKVTNVTDLKAGRSVFTVDFYIPQHYRPGGEKPFLDITDHPLKVTVR